MPALVCGVCGKISSKGGYLWEEEHPSLEMCDCPLCHIIRQEYPPTIEYLRVTLGDYYYQIPITSMKLPEMSDMIGAWLYISTRNPAKINTRGSWLADHEVRGDAVLWVKTQA